jgi:hypothetical protein
VHHAIASFIGAALLLAAPRIVLAGGGPFGIDHTVPYDNSGIWARGNQEFLIDATIVTVIGGSLVLGDQDKLGDTFWRSFDSMAVSAATAQAGKWVFQRKRPSQTDNPNEFFKASSTKASRAAKSPRSRAQ